MNGSHSPVDLRRSSNFIIRYKPLELYLLRCCAFYSTPHILYKKQHIPYAVLSPEGPNRLYEAMDLLQSGSYLAYYLALLMGIDPGPIPWVDWYKNEIRKVV